VVPGDEAQQQVVPEDEANLEDREAAVDEQFPLLRKKGKRLLSTATFQDLSAFPQSNLF
jgi:hypothetical protein